MSFFMILQMKPKLFPNPQRLPSPNMNSNYFNFPGFIALEKVTLAEVDKLLIDYTMHRELDSSPVWLIKFLRHNIALS